MAAVKVCAHDLAVLWTRVLERKISSKETVAMEAGADFTDLGVRV
jgi:hypothetical protein